MKIAYVTPRYGIEVVGGAEHAARMLAERVHSQLGWDVEVFTSCALDAATWNNELTPGTVTVNDVIVHRFATTEPRHPDFPKTSAKAHAHPQLTEEQLQEVWIRQQGPLVPICIRIAKVDADLVIFYPYLYYPTVEGIRAVPDTLSCTQRRMMKFLFACRYTRKCFRWRKVWCFKLTANANS